MSSPGCHIAISDGQIADDGHYWVVQVGAGGKLGVVGELSTPQSSFVFDPLAVAAGSVQSGSLVVVEANLIRYWPGPCGTTDEPRASACGPFEALSSESTDNAEGLITLPSGTYRSVTGTAGEPYTYGPPVHGLFLVRMQAYPWGSVLAELQTVPVGS